MSNEHTFRTSPETARKWHALAQRRRDDIVELYRSGRWRRYYTEEGFLTHMREVIKGVEAWNRVAQQDGGRPEKAGSKPSA